MPVKREAMFQPQDMAMLDGKARRGPRVKVECIDPKGGYYDHVFRRHGSVFYIQDVAYPEGDKRADEPSKNPEGVPKCFSKRWMRIVDPKTPLVHAKAPKQVPEHLRDQLPEEPATEVAQSEEEGGSDDSLI